MKSSKSQTRRRFHRIPPIGFRADEQLTSYAGLVTFWVLFKRLKLAERLRSCFAHQEGQAIFGAGRVALVLVVHLLLGFRRLRHLAFYQEDPLVCRIVGLESLPEATTVGRTIARVDENSLNALGRLQRDLVTERLQAESFPRLTLDFDGSVLSTSRHAEGTAVGFNKKKKGERSYYPLFATVAQSSQFFDMLFRNGNVHDSNGAGEFIGECARRIRSGCPRSILEMRIDSAFFGGKLFKQLDDWGIEFTNSVPFERFADLKTLIQAQSDWDDIDEEWSTFELQWRPKSENWTQAQRFIFVRQRAKVQQKGPIQLDLFLPIHREWRYTVIVTNKRDKAADIVAFHHGRGSQEKLFGEAKQHVALDVIPATRRSANELWTRMAMLSHNLGRELEMQANCPCELDDSTRSPRWHFESLGTLQKALLHRAGRLIRPQGSRILVMNENAAVRGRLGYYMGDELKLAA